MTIDDAATGAYAGGHELELRPDTRPIPLTPTTEAKGGLAVRMTSTWRPDQAQGAIALPMPASASITPSRSSPTTKKR